MKYPIIKKEQVLINDSKDVIVISNKYNYAFTNEIHDNTTKLFEVLQPLAYKNVLNEAPVVENEFVTGLFATPNTTNKIQFKLSRKELEFILKFCLIDDCRYYANGFALVKGEILASDAITLLRFKNVTSKEETQEGIFPKLSIERLLKFTKSKEYIFECYEDLFAVSCCDGYMESKYIQGTYPPVGAILEMEYAICLNPLKPFTVLELAKAKAEDKRIIYTYQDYNYLYPKIQQCLLVGTDVEMAGGRGILRVTNKKLHEHEAYCVPYKL